MTKQEELESLRVLKGHFQAVKNLEKKFSKKKAEIETELQVEIDRRSPLPPIIPTRPKNSVPKPGADSSSNKFSEQPPPKYFGIALGILHAIFVVIMSACILYFYTVERHRSATAFLPFVILLAAFHGAAIASLMHFDRKHKASGLIGFIVLAAISLGPTLGPMGEYTKEIPSYIIFTTVGLPATTAVIASVLKIVEFAQFKANQKSDIRKYNSACDRYKKDLAKYEIDLAHYNETLKRVSAQVKKEYQPKVTAVEQLCSSLRKEINEHKTAISTATILHKEHHGNIDYIIHLMETGVADSVKEALQLKRAEDQKAAIKRAEDQKAAHDRAQFEWNEFLRRRDEDRKWEEQRAQWARDQAQAERERERREQAERIADELEEIRKKLEKD